MKFTFGLALIALLALTVDLSSAQDTASRIRDALSKVPRAEVLDRLRSVIDRLLARRPSWIPTRSTRRTTSTAPSTVAGGCICYNIYQPVCGTNGITYGNSCFLKCAQTEKPKSNIQLAYNGQCKSNTTLAAAPVA